MLRHFEQQEGGVKVYTKNVLPKLFALGGAHHFVLIYQNPKLVGTYASYPNVEEVAVQVPGTVLWDQIAVPWIVRKMRLDLIFNPKITIPFFTTAKKVYVVHGAEKFAVPEQFARLDRWYFRLFMPLYSRHADAIVAVTRTVKVAAEKHLHADPRKVFAINNGYDLTHFRPVNDLQRLRDVRKKYRLPERFILWVGQFESRKNVPRLLRAFAAIRGKFPHMLVLAGGQRANPRSELKVIDELGLADRVIFPGWIPHADLPPVYAMADLFVFPSLHEGFGIPLLEAMACGCPIVTANTGSPPEVVAGAARLVDPLQIDRIADGMEAVLFDQALRTDMIARGMARAKDFSWDKCAAELLAMFNSLDERLPTADHGREDSCENNLPSNST
jgi:glycosyltransferase involved in cell wall biosynthesis